MKLIKSAEFRTYGGRTAIIDFTFPYPLFEKSDFFTREKLADTYANKTQHQSNPIIKCTKITYQ